MICLNPIKHFTPGALLILLLALSPLTGYGQTVGYQGRTLIASIAYIPATNISTILSESNYVDDFTTGDMNAIDMMHIVRAQVEFVVSENFSFGLRYNPYHVQVNKVYYDALYDTTNLLLIDAPGNMISLGLNLYYTPTPAPLGVHAGVYFTRYTFKTSLENNKYEPVAIPNEMANYTFEKSGAFGISANLGAQYIIRDRLTVDLAIEAGALFNNRESESSLDQEAFGGNFYFQDTDNYPQTMVVTNARAFFLANPMLSVGYLF